MPHDLFATIGEKRRALQDELIDAALAIIVTERCIGKDAKAVGALQGLIAELELRARDLTNAVDDSPITSRPRGWHTDPGGDTA